MNLREVHKKQVIVMISILGILLLGIIILNNFDDGIFFSPTFIRDKIENVPYFDDQKYPTMKANIGDPIIKKTYIYAGTLLASKSSENPSETQYYVQDHLGSNRKVINGVSEEQDNEFYAFGETDTIDLGDSDNNNNYKYTGKELDLETGLYYYGARYYNPEIGRFVQADTLKGEVSNPQSLNRYAYTMNNPMKFVDPTGNALDVELLGGARGEFSLSVSLSASPQFTTGKAQGYSFGGKIYNKKKGHLAINFKTIASGSNFVASTIHPLQTSKTLEFGKTLGKGISAVLSHTSTHSESQLIGLGTELKGFPRDTGEVLEKEYGGERNFIGLKKTSDNDEFSIGTGQIGSYADATSLLDSQGELPALTVGEGGYYSGISLGYKRKLGNSVEVMSATIIDPSSGPNFYTTGLSVKPSGSTLVSFTASYAKDIGPNAQVSINLDVAKIAVNIFK